MRDWHLEYSTAGAENRALSAAARLEALPDDEPRSAPGLEASAVLDRLDYPYPHLPASSVRAVVGASEAKRAVDPFADDHQPRGQPHYRPTFDAPAVLRRDADGITARQRGMLTHRVLEKVDLGRPLDEEVARLVTEGVITAMEADAIDAEALEWFAGTPLGRRISRAGPAYRREVSFISAEAADVFDPALEGVCDDTVLVRGIADGVLATEQSLEVIDFKTDAVQAHQVTERAERYRLQMRLYARALGRIWRRPVTSCHLVFLTPRLIIEVERERNAS
jgi:ATP-dependent helicase/nuclease subunit A